MSTGRRPQAVGVGRGSKEEAVKHREKLINRGVPYNPLLDQGYRSIGDIHSTAKPDPNNISSDAGERSGRWQGKSKSECGLHSNYWEMKKKFEQKTEGAPAQE